jgi:hypothetical protein
MDDAVVTADLATLIRDAIEGGEQISNIAARAGVSEQKLHAIIQGQYGTTSLTTADKILEAIGETTALLDGSVRTVPDGRSRRRPDVDET